MNSNNTYYKALANKNQIAVLIDPEKSNDEASLIKLLEKASFAGVDFIFVGGSTVTKEEFETCISIVKENTDLPVFIFPGSAQQVSSKADALLYLSLISGRNPDFLIGHHVASANEVYDMDISVLPTAYLLIDGGTNSSVAYVSQTTPIPSDKTSIILNTAKAGILQGKQVLYLDAGSGAKQHVPVEVVRKVSALDRPVIIGGGVRNEGEIEALHKAGANVVVIGNMIEEEMEFLLDIHNYKMISS